MNESKFHRSRLVPLSRDAHRELRHYLRQRLADPYDQRPDAPLLFNTHSGSCQGYTGAGLAQALNRIFVEADVHDAEAAGLECTMLATRSACRRWPAVIGGAVMSKRTCPSWLCIWGTDSESTRVFCNRNGGALTRFGVRYLVRKYLAASSQRAPTARQTVAPSQRASLDSGLATQIWSRLRHHCTMAWPCQA